MEIEEQFGVCQLKGKKKQQPMNLILCSALISMSTWSKVKRHSDAQKKWENTSV